MRTLIGHVVVAHGRDENGQEAIAVWYVDVTGTNTGAWVVPVTLDQPDPAAARQVLDLCLQRAVVAWQPAETISILERLARAAGVATPAWADTMIALPEAIGQVVTTRLAYEKHTNDVRAGTKVASIEWPVEVPEHIPATFEGMWQAVRLVLPAASSAARQALMTCALLRWTVQRWEETMTALSRRKYLQDVFGPPRVLPPGWESRLADAWTHHRVLA
jgi:Family of unknown function (DUF6218)